MVLEFHEKFGQLINTVPTHIADDRSENRYRLMDDEVWEYLEAVRNKECLPDLAKELVDILYTVYGTIIEHGLQDRIGDVFEEVHRSNMSKDADPKGYKMIKGDSYFEANVGQFFDSSASWMRV